MEDKKTLLSIKDLVVKFRVRGRVLTAIRGISLDIHENESIAIVGESGSGKSVFTKTFAGMLDENGFIDSGDIIFNDEELADTTVSLKGIGKIMRDHAFKKLNEYSKYEVGAEEYRSIKKLSAEKENKAELSEEENAEFEKIRSELLFKRTEASNYKQTLDSSKDKEEIARINAEIKACDEQLKGLDIKKEEKIKANKAALKNDTAYLVAYDAQIAELKNSRSEKIGAYTLDDKTRERNFIIANEIYLSIGRYGLTKRFKHLFGLLKYFKRAMQEGLDLNNEQVRNNIFDNVVFRVKYLDQPNEDTLHGTCVLNLSKIKYSKDWSQIRGKRIATVFQDPMTSLNPIITIGKQITSIILKHQRCTETEARERALLLMQKVGIPNAEKRFDDYPFQYSGGMRQRIVIAIALSCQPEILICDEPTTALDVTIQAQILNLLKDLQKEFGFTIVFITHDLGVVANIADRVAVLYAGQLVELGTVEEVFYDPRHPYTWALLSSLPQLAQKNTKLYSISGTPPSLYNAIVGDPFAPRNPYCLKIDTLKEPPMFKVTETHYAKTWLLDPRAPKFTKPEIIQNTHDKLIKAFNIQGG